MGKNPCTHTHTHFKVMFEQSFLPSRPKHKSVTPPPKQVGSALDSMMALIACLRAFNLAASWKLLRHHCQPQVQAYSVVAVGCGFSFQVLEMKGARRVGFRGQGFQ